MRALLARAEATEDNLETRARRKGRPPQKIHHNCSGQARWDARALRQAGVGEGRLPPAGADPVQRGCPTTAHVEAAEVGPGARHSRRRLRHRDVRVTSGGWRTPLRLESLPAAERRGGDAGAAGLVGGPDGADSPHARRARLARERRCGGAALRRRPRRPRCRDQVRGRRVRRTLRRWRRSSAGRGPARARRGDRSETAGAKSSVRVAVRPPGLPDPRTRGNALRSPAGCSAGRKPDATSS